jgi:hypothetical protein
MRGGSRPHPTGRFAGRAGRNQAGRRGRARVPAGPEGRRAAAGPRVARRSRPARGGVARAPARADARAKPSPGRAGRRQRCAAVPAGDAGVAGRRLGASESPARRDRHTAWSRAGSLGHPGGCAQRWPGARLPGRPLFPSIGTIRLSALSEGPRNTCVGMIAWIFFWVMQDSMPCSYQSRALGYRPGLWTIARASGSSGGSTRAAAGDSDG